jgi:hypothetical protein
LVFLGGKKQDRTQPKSEFSLSQKSKWYSPQN